MDNFPRIKRLPQYVFSIVNELKVKARQDGNDIIDFGMGNPDIDTAPHIVNKLIEVSKKTGTKRYSQSRGIPRLRKAICKRYLDQYGVTLDPEKEAITTIGSKEALSSLALAISGPGDTVLVPNPCYPIHTYGFVIAGAHVQYVALDSSKDSYTQFNQDLFLKRLEESIITSTPKPKAIVVNFPSNPTAQCVELEFFEKLVALGKQHQIWLIHDLAYGDIVYDGYKAPSILQVKGAKNIAVETYSLSKTYSMPGWRVGFLLGNEKLITATTRLKSYLDYGTFTPIQVAAIAALEGPQECIQQAVDTYKNRRNTLCDGLNKLGWDIGKPKASMFTWVRIPKQYQHLGSLEFANKLIREANVAASPGIGFGSQGEGYLRFALIENEQRIRQAIKGIKTMMKKDKTL